VGQGWLYTSNASKEQWETVTATGGSGTVEEVAEEVYPVGPVDPSLVDI
jgi:diacylglycerol kinase family enzyme